MRRTILSVLFATQLLTCAMAHAVDPVVDAPLGPVKVFILAGQSNMEGQAVVDLKGKDYNEGRGTIVQLLADPAKAAQLKHLQAADGKWTVRDDVWVRYQREMQPLLKGPLAFGFSVYGDVHHFGPELQFGHVVGDALDSPVLLIKTAWGGKSLYQDFRPPSSGGEVGKYYKLMISQVRESLARCGVDFPQLKDRDCELAGFVWYQGWNDGVEPKTAVPEYEQNLVNLINDVRKEFKTPRLPVVVGELTGPWVQAEGGWDALRKAQSQATQRPEFQGNVIFVPTHDFVRKPEESPNPTHGHHEFGNAETYFLVGDALGKGMLTLLSEADRGAALKLVSPLDYQVVQRHHKDQGTIVFRGEVPDSAADKIMLEARFSSRRDLAEWQVLEPKFDQRSFVATMELPAGGWYRLEVRALDGQKQLASAVVEHVGVGEVFVVAGQSNSANHGEEKQQPKSGQVATFDGERWQIANDPQPGASGGGGSFLPPLGDALARHFQVPIGFISCGIGATSVREWLPKEIEFPNPPTLVGNVQKQPNGQWISNGAAYGKLVSRMKGLGPQGFRAVLWHQGESDANQKDPSRTLAGELYREYLQTIIHKSRGDIGWDAPWFVAQVSYHVPGDEASPDIRAAQASLWKKGIALEGPDSDALTKEWREANGQGVHFSGRGLREHAARWLDKITPWLEQQE